MKTSKAAVQSKDKPKQTEELFKELDLDIEVPGLNMKTGAYRAKLIIYRIRETKKNTDDILLPH